MKRRQQRFLTLFLGGVCLGAPLGGQALARSIASVETIQPLQIAQSYTDLIANALFQHYALGQPAPNMTAGVSAQQAGQLQVGFVRRLRADLGPVVGFKAALTNPTAQEQFGVNHPLYGFLLEEMMLESGDSLPLKFGARPVAEGDLMVRVSSESINTATTDADLLASLDAVIPFMELPDLFYAENAIVDATALVAINAGTRYGVMGAPIDLEATEAWMTRLGQVQVRLINDAGQTIASGDSTELMGHPISSVRWLRDTLIAQGVTLQPGDLLSLGAITPPVPVEEGRLKARYYGLAPDRAPGDALEISVKLKE
ncbi:MAG: hydratase [Cyanobacteria bacterium P01_D01_bin.44]